MLEEAMGVVLPHVIAEVAIDRAKKDKADAR